MPPPPPPPPPPPDRAAAPGRRPVFAFLCNQAVIERLERAARAAGAADGTGGLDRSAAVDGYGRFLRAINRLSFSPEGEPLRRLVEPCVYKATPSTAQKSVLCQPIPPFATGTWFAWVLSTRTRCQH